MDRDPNRDDRDDRAVLADGRDRRTVSRYFAREREKQELRRERDAVMLRIARDLGVGGLAQKLDVAPAAVDKMLAAARTRLGAGPSGSGPTITVRRAAADRDRWADVDAYYEALGSRPRMLARRRLPPKA